ncbi:hypothetical protein DSL64_07680 [Dyadobacter luteus]|uniref:Uncharacterized protein n=1 Tax=Dyadobacter luteus TaxID=2259619 RepID=A0A3D8YEC8_9BACT|nr:hypothetical protein DSL64_07680 [Dyadobacter luteus]
MTKALPILTQLHEWMQQEYPKVLPHSPIGKAIGYALPLMESKRLCAPWRFTNRSQRRPQ